VFFGENPRLSFIHHSLNVGVVEKSPAPPLTGEQYGKMDPKYPEVGRSLPVLSYISRREWEISRF